MKIMYPKIPGIVRTFYAFLIPSPNENDKMKSITDLIAKSSDNLPFFTGSLVHAFLLNIRTAQFIRQNTERFLVELSIYSSVMVRRFFILLHHCFGKLKNVVLLYSIGYNVMTK